MKKNRKNKSQIVVTASSFWSGARFSMEDYIAWNRKRWTATLDELEIKVHKERIGELELEWIDFNLPTKKSKSKKVFG